jgi:sulfate transport system ATP-binding protein
MDVASQIAVMNAGRIEQVGSPTKLYDEPETEFVMRFVGDASSLDGELVRPHDIDLAHEPVDGAVEAMVERVTLLGFAAKIELVDGDGRALVAVMTRDHADELELERGQIVWARSATTVAVV